MVAAENRGIPVKIVLRMAVLFECGLALVAALWGYFRGLQITFEVTGEAMVQGLWATGPIIAFNFGIFAVLANRPERYPQFARFREEIVYPVCANLSIGSAIVVALFSGLCEEFFFRGVLDQELSSLLGMAPGVACSAFLFAYVHFIGIASQFRTVILVYFLFGLYFSYVAISTENLLPACVAHALYNFLAILYMRYVYQIERSRTP